MPKPPFETAISSSCISAFNFIVFEYVTDTITSRHVLGRKLTSHIDFLVKTFDSCLKKNLSEPSRELGPVQQLCALLAGRLPYPSTPSWLFNPSRMAGWSRPLGADLHRGRPELSDPNLFSHEPSRYFNWSRSRNAFLHGFVAGAMQKNPGIQVFGVEARPTGAGPFSQVGAGARNVHCKKKISTLAL